MEIDSSLVSRLIAEQFPQWAQLPIAPVEPNGWDNRTFRLGDEMSVRLPSAACYAAQVDKEQQWLPRLAPLLPLPIPVPLARGVPSHGYPWHWSVCRWIDGENATVERIGDLNPFANTLAEFLTALQRIDPAGGPAPGEHNFYRGGPLTTYDREARDAIASLHGQIETAAATEVWQTALNSAWNGPPVWVHGDIHPTNLLVRDGCLNAVIDFGCSGVGDPACDFTIAWTFFSGDSRETFRAAIGTDDSTWERSRGWALWKAAITLADNDPRKAAGARRTIDAVLAESHRLG